MELQFQPATEADVPEVAAMMADFYAIDGYAFDAHRSETNLQLFVRNPELGRLWLLLWGEEVIGYAALTFCFSFEFGGKTAFLDELYLVPECRGKGLGKQAVAFVCRQARKEGVQAVHLEVELHNGPGRRLYGRVGFREHNRILMTWHSTE
ncbi:GNAT family N-acetyltransferase [Paraflavisolibacter sp. H34]|uniref:GNAT family N-acetyltransferase n=1 Tax=Huijunlia imazamoxiresistens TaxID=3127457 RepID=UPI0030185318